MASQSELDQKVVSAADETPYPSTGYAWYVVGVLTLVYVFSFVDRQILNLLVRPIRRDLGISDTQMSLLMGFSFALFYTSGPPGRPQKPSHHHRRRVRSVEHYDRRMRAGQKFHSYAVAENGSGRGRSGPLSRRILAHHRLLPEEQTGHSHQRLLDGNLYRVGPGSGSWRLGGRSRLRAGGMEPAHSGSHSALANYILHSRPARNPAGSAYVHRARACATRHAVY